VDELSTPLIVSVGVLALVAFLVFKLVQHVKQQNEERRASLRLLGFEPLTPADADQLDKLKDLCRRFKGDSFRIDDVMLRNGSDHRLLLFDLTDTSGDNDSKQQLAVVSRRLALPRFTLYPRLELEGRLAAFANSVIEKLVGHGGKTVRFSSHPAFERRHFVKGEDEDAIRRFFDAARLEALAAKQYLMLEAGGDGFTVGRVQLPGQAQGPERADLAERVREAEELLRLFSAHG